MAEEVRVCVQDLGESRPGQAGANSRYSGFNDDFDENDDDDLFPSRSRVSYLESKLACTLCARKHGGFDLLRPSASRLAYAYLGGPTLRVFPTAIPRQSHERLARLRHPFAPALC